MFNKATSLTTGAKLDRGPGKKKGREWSGYGPDKKQGRKLSDCGPDKKHGRGMVWANKFRQVYTKYTTSRHFMSNFLWALSNSSNIFNFSAVSFFSSSFTFRALIWRFYSLKLALLGVLDSWNHFCNCFVLESTDKNIFYHVKEILMRFNNFKLCRIIIPKIKSQYKAAPTQYWLPVSDNQFWVTWLPSRHHMTS